MLSLRSDYQPPYPAYPGVFNLLLQFSMFFFIIKTPPRCFFRIILNVLKHGQKLERKNVFAQKLIALPKEN